MWYECLTESPFRHDLSEAEIDRGYKTIPLRRCLAGVGTSRRRRQVILESIAGSKIVEASVDVETTIEWLAIDRE